MKILFINYEFPPLGGGGGTTSKFLAQHLAARGHEIKILTAGFTGLPEHETKDRYEIFRIRCKRKAVGESNFWEMFSFVARAVSPMLHKIHNWKPDTLHIFFAFPTGPLGFLARTLTNTPYVVSLLGGDVPGFLPRELNLIHTPLKLVFRKVLSNADAVIANSIGLQKLTEKSFNKKLIHVITNGIDLSQFQPREHTENSSEFKLLFIGRFVPQKGLDILLHALDAMVNQHGARNIHLDIVGDGPEQYKNEYLEFMKTRRLTHYITLHGWVPLERLPDFYSPADVFVLPSTFEGMASVVLQSLACGTPVVSTRVYGSVDLIHEGQNGFLIDINSPGQLCEQLLKVYSNPSLLRTLKNNARESIKSYRWENIAQKYENLYAESLQKCS